MADGPLVWRFPMPDSQLIDDAYWDIERSENGTATEQHLLGDHDRLPKPWDVATCADPDLRRDVWNWYDRIVTWFNHEYVWDPAAGMIPPCWPLHPHLVHEIGVVADQRRRIEMATNANALEEWHRYVVPALIERIQKRVKQHCDDHHQAWPARARFAHHGADAQAQRRSAAFESDLESLAVEDRADRPRLLIVDENGELIDPETGEVP